MTSRLPLEANHHAWRSPAGRDTRGRQDHDFRRGALRFSATIVAIALLTACAPTNWDSSVDVSPMSTKTTGKTQAGTEPSDVDKRTPGKAFVQKGDSRLVQAAGTAATFTSEQNGDISLNFVNANVRDVADAVLGQMLHLNYAVDPKVQATITMQTAKPIAKDAVLPLLENALEANGVALVRSDDLYRLVPLAGAAKSGSLPVKGGSAAAGYGLQIIPLKYASAVQLQKVLEPFVPTGGVLQVDDARNMLLVSGTQRDIDSFVRLVNVFDIDALNGMSFGLFPLKQGAAASVARELTTILNSASGGSGAVKVIPIERINAILLVSAQPAYIQKGQDWIERLDAGIDESAPRIYVYYVQNSRAADLAKVLGQVFGTSSIQNAQPQTAPGSAMSILGGGSAGGYGGTGGTGLGTAANPAPVLGMAPTGSAANPAPGAQPPVSATGSDANGLSPLPPPVGIDDRGEAAARPGEKGRAQIVADEKNNALVIRCRPSEYRMIESALKKLDILPQQILIEATVAEVTLNDSLQYGLQWFFKQGGAKLTLSTAASGALSSAFPGFSAVFGGGGGTQAVLNALSDITTVNVVSAPHLMVLDHQTAMLQVGDEVPVATQSAISVATSGAPVVNSIQLINTGVILRVTPRINANGVATLDIEQEVSAATKTTTSGIDSPTIQQRRFRTTVAVGNGETLALGGLIQETKNKDRSGVPILSDIPVLGALTSNTTKGVKRTELLVLLTPTVVHDSEDARAVTDELQQRIHSLLPVKPRKI